MTVENDVYITCTHLIKKGHIKEWDAVKKATWLTPATEKNIRGYRDTIKTARPDIISLRPRHAAASTQFEKLIFGAVLGQLSTSKLSPHIPWLFSISPFGLLVLPTPPPPIDLAPDESVAEEEEAPPPPRRSTPKPPPPSAPEEGEASSGATVVVSMQQSPQSIIEDSHALAASFALVSGVDSSRSLWCMTLACSLSIVLLREDVVLWDVLIVWIDRSRERGVSVGPFPDSASEGEEEGTVPPPNSFGTSFVGVSTIVLSIPIPPGDDVRCRCCCSCRDRESR
jgi:hypothetical protein